jgi:hypothetical protein
MRRPLLSLLAGFCLGLGGCQFAENARYLALQGELIDAQKTIRQYEERYGKIQPADRREFDVRRLVEELPGKSMADVIALLGRPTKLFEVNARESWLYKDAVYDSVTKRNVRSFEVWFVGGRVSEVFFSY